VENQGYRAASPVKPFVLPCHWTPENIVQPTRPQAFIKCSKENKSPTFSSPSSSPLSSSSVLSPLSSESQSSSLPSVSFRPVSSDVTPSIASLGTDVADVLCLEELIRERCVDEGRAVPRVAHFVRFSKTAGSQYEFPLDHFISMVSAARFLQVSPGVSNFHVRVCHQMYT
jgi:hypothetical protein